MPISLSSAQAPIVTLFSCSLWNAMFEDSVSVPSIWASMNSWFTPTVLFVLLNVMIGTIAFTSSFANQKRPQHQQHQHQHQHQQTQDEHQQPRLARSPSVLQRLKSISLYTYRYQEPNPSPSITTHLKPTPDWDTHYPPQQTRQQQTLETEGQHYFQHHQEQEPLQAETQFVAEQNLDDVEIVLEDDLQTMDEIYGEFCADHHVSRTMSDTKPASGEVPAKLPEKMRKSASMKSTFAHFEEGDIVETIRPATVREGRARMTEVDEEVDAKADDFINRFKQQLKLQRLDSIVRYKELINRGSEK